ncbi:MAG: hypothetical protein AAGA66_04035 [Bacteroidota bacterium]
MAITTIDHNGKQIVFVDYTQCKTKEATIEKLREAAEYIRKESHPVLVLSDFTGTFATKEFMSEANRLNKEILDRKTRKGAVLGITGVKKILLDGYNLLSRQSKLVPFLDKQEALDYLVNK